MTSDKPSNIRVSQVDLSVNLSFLRLDSLLTDSSDIHSLSSTTRSCLQTPLMKLRCVCDHPQVGAHGVRSVLADLFFPEKYLFLPGTMTRPWFITTIVFITRRRNACRFDERTRRSRLMPR